MPPTSLKAQFPDETDEQGSFARQPSAFRNWVSADESSQFQAAPGRYHLYFSYACPWAQRTVIFRLLKRLEGVVSMSTVDPIRDELGWAFREVADTGLDPVNGFSYLSEAYKLSDPGFSGRVTVPVLWDRQTRQIVNNESADIIRIFNSEFNAFTDCKLDFYPLALREEIEKVNERIYTTVNNGVYRCGFATTQQAYEAAFVELFDTLDWLDRRLGQQRYLVGDQLTEADWRLFTTLVRFDSVYYSHFKCNQRRIAEYPNLWPYLRELYQYPGVAKTVKMDQIKRHYYVTHTNINPTKIVPLGPEIDFAEPHGRDRLAASDH